MAIEIHLDGKPVTKLEAARALAEVGGRPVRIGEKPAEGGWVRDDVVVFARHHAYGSVQPPAVNCMSFGADDPAKMRHRAQMILLAAEVAELAEMIAAEQVTEFTTSSLEGVTAAPCLAPEQHGPELAGANVECDVAAHHGPARISEAAVDKAMATQLGWCPASTGPDEELPRALYCDKQLGEDGKHAGNHHAHVGDGSEVMWGDEDDPWIRNGTRFGAAEPAATAGPAREQAGA